MKKCLSGATISVDTTCMNLPLGLPRRLASNKRTSSPESAPGKRRVRDNETSGKRQRCDHTRTGRAKNHGHNVGEEFLGVSEEDFVAWPLAWS